MKKAHTESIKAVRTIQALLKANPDLAYLMFRASHKVFNVHAIETSLGIPGGSLYTAKDKPGQTSYKHSEKLAGMFSDMLEEVARQTKITARTQNTEVAAQ